jgi:serine/threonine protein phosphatase 1
MPSWMPAPAFLPAGKRIYAVGDVHGCATRLATMHRLIARDLAERPVQDPTVVHMGDYIDRGPDSAGVVAMLIDGPAVPGVRVVNLRGNHEQMMLTALASGDLETAAQWLTNGGSEALQSWRVSRHSHPIMWASQIPKQHRDFVSRLALSERQGGYLFVHAGVRPGIPMRRQSPYDLLWIREPFLSSEAHLGAVIVHGHTPSEHPVIRANRIGIDTGAVLGGALTCAILEADRVGFIFA